VSGTEPVDVRRALAAALTADEWAANVAAELADVAYRRWNSFERRHPKRESFEDRVLDLTRGLRERSPVDPIYVAPGEFERIARRLAEVLSAGGESSATNQ